MTHLRTWEGWLHLAAVQDAYSRRIVGWQMADHMRAELVVDELKAIERRRPKPGLIHHSDQGSQLGLNWSSQHLIVGVYRQAGWMDEGIDGQGVDEVAGASDPSAGCRAAVLV